MIEAIAIISLLATLAIMIAMHGMKERASVIWGCALFLFWCGVAPIRALALILGWA